MAFLRFAVPSYDFQPFKGLSWAAPTYLGSDDIERLADAQASGDASAYGCYPVMPGKDIFAKFDIRGDHCHAVMCVTPSTTVHLLGRSYAWWNQRALILDSLATESLNVVHDWRTPRPMNNRFGPDDGVELAGGVYFIISSHMYDDHWIANRTILDNEWGGGDAAGGFRVLGASKDEADEFCECNLSISWNG